MSDEQESVQVGNELERHSIMEPLLARWAAAEFGERVEVLDVVRLPGHSGITFSFAVSQEQGVQRLVIKVPPLGVTQRNNTDVLRQVPVLQLMAEVGVRVPTVRAYGTEADSTFPVPYLVVDHVPGKPPGDIFTGPLDIRGDQSSLFDDAVAELARIHAASWNPRLRDWSRVRSLRDEVDHWVPVLQKAEESSWVRNGLAVRDRLLETMPTDIPVGVVHGDFYSNNWMFDDGGLTAVLDWENSAIGPHHLDIGWLCMMYDPESWGPTRREWMVGDPTPEWLLARYESHANVSVRDADWYRALAGYRLACLTAYYLRLHRTGRRVDEVWEVFGEAFPYLLGRAQRLLQSTAKKFRVP